MYLPLGSLTLLRFLQLPFLLSNSEQPQLLERSDLDDLGNLSPYHDAPASPGVSADLPDDCTVDQVILLHRHGSRGPVNEQSFIRRLVNTLDHGRDAIQRADLPPNLEFLKEGYAFDLEPQNLTAIGRQQLFDHGVEFFLRYPTFSTDEVISTKVPRVIDSAHFFVQGRFGRDTDRVRYLTMADFSEVSWLDSWKACPKLNYSESNKASQQWTKRYIPPIVDRLNDLVPGVGFTSDDIQGALFACPYDLAARGKSPWCDVFTTSELRGLEYQLDLVFDIYTGYTSKGDPGPIVGALYIKKLIERWASTVCNNSNIEITTCDDKLTDTTKNAKRLHLDFAHDLTILFALATMGLNKDVEPLSPLVSHPPPHRKFRTSYQTPFAANMIWEKFTCKKSFSGPQVRLVLNDETFPLSICQHSQMDRMYGTCSLEEFLRANEYSMNVEYHGKIWNATCERGL